MPATYPAHIRIDADGTKTVQSCADHSINSAKYASAVLETVELSQSAYLAGLLHDCGKFKNEFQTYLEKAASGDPVYRGRVVHTFAGARYLLERFHTHSGELTLEDTACEMLAYAVGAHHGLFDCVDERHRSGFLHRLTCIPDGDTEAAEQFMAQCASQKAIDELFACATKELTVQLEKCMELARSDDETMFLAGLLVRLLTSAVIEGDRRDTAEFMEHVVYPPPADQELWQILLDRTEEKIRGFPGTTSINRARRTISDTCRAAADRESGIYRLNVPTGGGKTLASLRYALAHAARYEKRRIIFVSPLLSILDQNSRVIRDMLENDAVVLEHHSNVVIEPEDTEDAARQALLTDSWSSPVIITTLVQLLNTMFDGKTSCIRRFHALTNAVIVIDEVQTVPDKLLTLFHLTISFLAQLMGTTVVLCSATQPFDQAVSHPIRAAVGEIVPYDEQLWNIFRRTRLENAGSRRLDEIPALAREILEKNDSLLIVCNKKDQAQTILQLMKDGAYDLFHLSASMCMAHRKAVLDRLYASLEETRRKTVCVSTQVIEAGVDISFGAVIRLAAGMDSVVQSAGRCNRNGESDTPGSVYIVQIADENLSRLPDIHLAKQATLQLQALYEQAPQRYGNDLASSEAVKEYYHQLFTMQQLRGNDYHDGPLKDMPTLYSLLSENTRWLPEREQAMSFSLSQGFASAGAAFSVFDDDTTDVIVPYREGSEIIGDLLSERAKYDTAYVRQCLERAKGYTISIYGYKKRLLTDSGGLTPLAGDMMLALGDLYYDEEIGLCLNREVSDACSILIL